VRVDFSCQAHDAVAADTRSQERTGLHHQGGVPWQACEADGITGSQLVASMLQCTRGRIHCSCDLAAGLLNQSADRLNRGATHLVLATCKPAMIVIRRVSSQLQFQITRHSGDWRRRTACVLGRHHLQVIRTAGQLYCHKTRQHHSLQKACYRTGKLNRIRHDLRFAVCLVLSGFAQAGDL
jgi:hypothetical protein